MAKKKMTLEEKLEEAIVKDVPYEVPENWVWVKLGDYIDYATIVNDNLRSFPCEALGIDRIENKYINYTNILKF